MPTPEKGYNDPPAGHFARGALGQEVVENFYALDTDLEAPWDLDLQSEGEQTGLAADAAGVQYETAISRTLLQALVDSNHDVVLVAATTSSAGDETVTIELYDETAAAVVASVDVAGGGQSESADISGALTGGNPAHVRYNVTTASATAGATFDAHGALLTIR